MNLKLHWSYKLLRELLLIIISLIIGYYFASFLVKPLIAEPTNLNFLAGDALQHYIGWGFFRNDNWSFPITMSSSLMYPYGTSISFTDSFPIVSIFLKLISSALPSPFEWHGVVAIFNCSIMFYTGLFVFRNLRNDIMLGILGGFILLFSSPFIWRFFGHFSLTTQWLFVLNIYLVIKPRLDVKKDVIFQVLLIIISAATHPYIAFMCLLLSASLAYKVCSIHSFQPLTKVSYKFETLKRMMALWAILSICISVIVCLFVSYVKINITNIPDNEKINDHKPVITSAYYQLGYSPDNKKRIKSIGNAPDVAKRLHYLITSMDIVGINNSFNYSINLNAVVFLYTLLGSQRVPFVKSSLNDALPINISIPDKIVKLTSVIILFCILFSFGAIIAYLINKLFFTYIRSQRRFELSSKKVILNMFIYGFIIILIISGYFLGWFTNQTSSGAMGYGYHSANVLSLINPQFGSILFNPISVGSGQYEGFAYLGIGLMAASILLLCTYYKECISSLKLKYLRGFYYVLLVSFLVSISNTIQISTVSIHLPYSGNFLSVVRASGRFIWVIFYSIELFIILKVYDFFKTKHIIYAYIFLTVVVFLQFVDNKPLMKQVRTSWNQNATVDWKYDLKSKLWFHLKDYNYNHIILVEQYPDNKEWVDKKGYPIIFKFALLAIYNGVTINDAYLSRRSSTVDNKIKNQWTRIVEGVEHPQQDELYIVDDKVYNNKMVKDCTILDGYHVCGQNIDKFLPT